MNWISPNHGNLIEDNQIEVHVSIPCEVGQTSTTLSIEVIVYYCTEAGVCKMKGFIFKQQLLISSVGDSKSYSSFSCELS